MENYHAYNIQQAKDVQKAEDLEIMEAVSKKLCWYIEERAKLRPSLMREILSGMILTESKKMCDLIEDFRRRYAEEPVLEKCIDEDIIEDCYKDCPEKWVKELFEK